MILDTAYRNGITAAVPKNACHIWIDLFADFCCYRPLPCLRAEDEVDNHVCEGLRHLTIIAFEANGSHPFRALLGF